MLAGALRAAGHEAVVAPMYLPLHLEDGQEQDARPGPLFFGGVSMYLRQRHAWVERVPGWMTRWMDHPALLRAVARRANLTDAASHGEMTLAMLRHKNSRMERELERLSGWLADEKPDVLCLSTALQAGLIGPLKRRLKLRVVCSFQGEDSFLDRLPEPFRRRCWRELALRLREADALVAPSRFYAGLMRGRLDPCPENLHIVPNGVCLDRFAAPSPAEPPVIGYLARMNRDKGLEVLVDAFIHLRTKLGHPDARLHIGGAATPADKPLIVGLIERLRAAGLLEDVTFQPNLSHAEKVALLSGLSVFSVPALYPEAFGLYVAEAMAAGLPVVQPAASAFPELLGDAGLLVPPGDRVALAECWLALLENPDRRLALAAAAREAAERKFGAALMAERFHRVAAG